MTVVVVLSLLLAVAAPPIRPDARLTPGDVATTDARAICTPGYASRHRDVTDAKKRAIYTAYGIQPSGRYVRARSGKRTWSSNYEVDHLISLQLGGSNAPANLWPQSYRLRTNNAYWKDALENRLHWLVCHGQLTLPAAQDAIRTDWVRAYDTFITHGPPKSPIATRQ